MDGLFLTNRREANSLVLVVVGKSVANCSLVPIFPADGNGIGEILDFDFEFQREIFLSS